MSETGAGSPVASQLVHIWTVGKVSGSTDPSQPMHTAYSAGFRALRQMRVLNPLVATGAKGQDGAITRRQRSS